MPSVTVGTTPTAVAPISSQRQSIYLRNQSTGGQKMGIDYVPPMGLTMDNAGYILDPGEWLAFSLLIDGKEVKQPWSAIADGAGGTLYYRDMNEMPESAGGI